MPQYDPEQGRRALKAARYYLSRRDKRRRNGPTIEAAAKLHSCELWLLQQFVGIIRSGRTPSIHHYGQKTHASAIAGTASERAIVSSRLTDYGQTAKGRGEDDGNAKRLGAKTKAMRSVLPAWYYRLLRASMGPDDPEVMPWDFDQDISDLEDETNEGEEEGGESPNMGYDCECQSEDTDEEDEDEEDERTSERSYDGSDADYYYELKEMREERKIELREARRQEQKAREKAREYEDAKVKEVQEAYESLVQAEKEGKPAAIAPISSMTFHLFSVDHVDHLYDSHFYPTKYVSFYNLDGEGNYADAQNDKDNVYGHVYFRSDTDCDFGPFQFPTQASSNEVRLKCHGPSCRNCDMTLRFISNDYLKLKLSRDWVFTGRAVPPCDVPDIFEFAGIRHDFEKAKEERLRWKAGQRAKRSPSPRESWFERCHPMGAWNSAEYRL